MHESRGAAHATATGMLLEAGAWPDLRASLAMVPATTKGQVFELLVREFLQLDARYDFTEVWSTHAEVPKAVLQELNLFGRDVTGIDLVARTRQGRYWAVQCKYHQDEAWSLSRKEATGLIAGRSRARGGFELGLICTTANSRSPNLAGEPHLEYLMGDVWRGLDAAFFARLHAQLRGAAPRPPERKKPRPHQVEALKAITKYFSANARGKVIMPCATGKSLIGFWAAERLGAKRVLVAVPNLSLVRQLLKDWTEQSMAAGRRPTWAVVCSDDSVADTTSARDLGVKVDTDPKEVTAWLRETKGSDFSVVFTTYQSGKVLAQGAKLAGVTFDLGIFDEAHRTAGREGAPFAYLLDEKNITVERRVFMTATPRIFKGKSRDDVISMDDPAQFGGDAYRMTFLQAMEREIIPNLTIVAVTVASAEVERILKNKLFLRLKREYGDDVIRSEELVAALALRKAMQKYGIRRSLGFNSSRKRCHRAGDIQRLLTEVLPAYGALEVFHVDGEMTSAERDCELRAFEGSHHALMTNVRVFVEGVDCPSMDAVLFADPKQSIIDIVQGVGRALRPFYGKTAGYAIIPTVIDKEGVPTDAAYEQLVRVTCALGSEDEVILDYFAAVAQGKPWTGARVFEVLGDVEVGLQVDLEKVNQAIAVRTYERTNWAVVLEDYFALAKKRGFKFMGKVLPANIRMKAPWQCSKGHTWDTDYGSISSGRGCPYCANRIPKTIEDYRALARKRGFTFLGEVLPKNTGSKAPWQCSRGHRWEAPHSNIVSGHGCPRCAGLVRKTIDDYRALARTHGLTFVGEEVPSGVTLRSSWRCSEGHVFHTRYATIYMNHGCPHCAGVVRKTIEDYRAMAKARGFKFLGKVAPSSTRIGTAWQCSKGHRWEATYGGIRGGSGCHRCAGVVRKTLADYEALARERGFKFLGKVVPANSHSEGPWQCSKGHRWAAPYKLIARGHGCHECGDARRGDARRKTIDDYRSLAQRRGFEFLEKKVPANAHTKCRWQCSNGHRWKQFYTSISVGVGCPECWEKRRGSSVRKSIEDYRELAKRRGFKFPGRVIPANVLTKAIWRCARGHEWEARYNAIHNGHGCPSCRKDRRSKRRS